jgi:hypothetical protein
VFKVAFKKTFTADSIYAGFLGARLALYNPYVVLLKLNIQLRTLTLSALDTVT